MQALKTLESRGGTGWDHAIFSDSRRHPGGFERRSEAWTAICDRDGRKATPNTVTPRTPTHQGGHGSETADEWAKEVAAESLCNSAQKTILRESSLHLAFVSRGVTEPRTRMVLPDSDGTCRDPEHRGKRVLLVLQRRAVVPVPPGGQMQGLDSSEKEGGKGGRKGVRVEASTRNVWGRNGD